MPEFKVMPDPAAVAREAADRIVLLAEAAIKMKGTFSIALAGGSTPEALFNLLAAEPYRSQVDWSKVLVFFGDERCVPPDDKESNYRMARERLLSKVLIPGDNVYRMHGEDDPEQAAREYDKILAEHFQDVGIDLVLLGMGDDGHTASLFPHTRALYEDRRFCVANHVPQKNVWRVTMTYPFINRASTVMICVTGSAKTARLAEVLEGERDSDRLPIQRISPLSGQLIWVLDAAAAGM